jgi:UDP-N-acetylmuramoyl-L-alanyl-D-glutamate--2,6-diaminopimelate ligase
MKTVLRRLKGLVPDRHPLRLIWHRAKAFVAALRYGFPARKLTVIGITGTDGKTTTVAMVAHILFCAGRKVGAASTAFLQVNGDREENATHLTSINPFILQRFLRRLVREGCEFVVLEMSSHGLVQGRASFTFPVVCVITNLTPESLDYHGSMEQYREDKGKMFRMLKGGGTKVLNGTDDACAYFKGIPSKETMVYGVPDEDLWVTDVRAGISETTGTLHMGLGGKVPLRLPIPGVFNLENAQCAIGCAMALGIPLDRSLEALESFPAVPGRMERIEAGQDFSVYVDFTITPAAYKNTLCTLRSIVGEEGRVLVLCSSCGNRMPEKRPEVGRICSEFADIVVVTEDETYGEDPRAVWEEVWAGVDQTLCKAHKIFDRREGITFLLGQAKRGDAVLFCGMGPFSTMMKLHGSVSWDERKVVREALQGL